jgi:hypothetical protein
MNRKPNELFLIIAFLAIIIAAPVAQVVVEAGRGDLPEVLRVFRRMPTRDSLAAFESELEDGSVTIRTLRPWIQGFQFLALHDGGAKTLVAGKQRMFYAPGVNTLTQRPRPGESSAAEALKAVISFRNDLERQGIRLILMPVPNKESIYPDWLNPRAAAPRRIIQPETRGFLTGCEAAGVEVVDLFTAFMEERHQRSEPLFLSQDTHWSPAGIEIAARIAAQRVGNKGTNVFECVASPVSLHGDLVRMIRSPWIESWLPPEDIRTVQVRGIGDDEAATVLVLGDSFSRVFQSDEPGSSGFIAHLAHELRQPVASLVNDGGAATLVRQELHRRPEILRNRKIVIWEFTERDLRLATDGWQSIRLR